MIEVKDAVGLAKAKAVEMLGENGSLEEIERDHYQGHEVWSITLGFPPKAVGLSMFLQYKRFLIDAETGELLAMKLRELASQ